MAGSSVSMVFAVASMLCVDARAAATVLGWHQSGAFSYQIVNGQPQVCREDTTDVPQGWPEGVDVGPGEACGNLPEKVGKDKAADWAKKDAKQKADKKSPLGVEVKLDAKEGGVVAVNGEKKLLIGKVDASAKLGDAWWRPDGTTVAVVVETGATTQVLHKELSSLLVGGPAGRKLAERAHGEGMKLMKKRDWSGAGRQFEAAITADPEWPPARYARAAAEAQSGVGRTAMVDNLTWLKERAEKDAASKKLLVAAQGDSAFDAWIGEPDVRDLLGLPKVQSMTTAARLLEKKGMWTMQGATCKSPWVTLQLSPISEKGKDKGFGKIAVLVSESCKGKKTQKKGEAVYSAVVVVGQNGAPAPAPVAPGTPGTPPPSPTYVFQWKKPIEGLALPSPATILVDPSYQKLKLAPAKPDGDPKEGEPQIGDFEPGAARVDDSTL